MGNAGSSMLHVNLQTPSVKSGDILRGSVVVHLGAPAPLSNLMITVVGQERSHWIEQESRTRTVNGPNNEKRTETYYVDVPRGSTNQFMSCSLPILPPNYSGFNQMYAPGTYELPFALQVPMGIPGTFSLTRGKCTGEVKYFVRAELGGASAMPMMLGGMTAASSNGTTSGGMTGMMGGMMNTNHNAGNGTNSLMTQGMNMLMQQGMTGMTNMGGSGNASAAQEVFVVQSAPAMFHNVTGSVSDNVYVFCCVNKGKMNIDFTADKEAYTMGEQVTVNADISNQSTVKIPKISLKVGCVFELSDGSGKVKKEHFTVHKSTLPGLPKGATIMKLPLAVQIPSDIPQQTISRLVKCNYYVQVVCKVSWGSDICCTVPISIYSLGAGMIQMVAPPVQVPAGFAPQKIATSDGAAPGADSGPVLILPNPQAMAEVDMSIFPQSYRMKLATNPSVVTK